MQCRDPFSGDCDAVIAPARPAVAIAILAVPRPVFRGLRPRAAAQMGANPGLEPCSAETRFQGIATGGPRRRREPGRHAALQCRDPVSGDCDSRITLTHPGRITSPACSAETRFQGIATSEGGRCALSLVKRSLQCRDPFSGDCDTIFPRCFFLWPQKTLAVPRPVFRGLRPGVNNKRGSVFGRTCSAETRFQGIATRGGPPC